jgi:hypothetical protein
MTAQNHEPYERSDLRGAKKEGGVASLCLQYGCYGFVVLQMTKKGFTHI